MNIKEFKNEKEGNVKIYNLDNKLLYNGFIYGIPNTLEYIEIGNIDIINESTFNLTINQK